MHHKLNKNNREICWQIIANPLFPPPTRSRQSDIDAPIRNLITHNASSPNNMNEK